MAGWIKLHRQIKEHWLWEEKPFDKRSAFTDMILSANHEDKKVPLGNELINVKRGSFITSEVKLADKWGWSRKKVRVFLEVLEQDKMIVKKSTTKYTSLTIANYDIYQDEGTTKEQQKNSKGTAKEHQKNTNKNEKNEKNEKNIKPIGEQIENYTSNPDLQIRLLDFVDMRKKTDKAGMTDRAFELMLKELDKLASDNDTKIKILEQSIMKNWKGVFELKEEKNKSSPQYQPQKTVQQQNLDTMNNWLQKRRERGIME